MNDTDTAAQLRHLRDTLGPDHPDTQAAFKARLAEVAAEESENEWAWWWLSFVDTELPYVPEDDYPGGGRFQGVCIVRARGLIEATQVAYLRGCNPGGQVAGFQLPAGVTDEEIEPYTYRLLSAAEVEQWST